MNPCRVGFRTSNRSDNSQRLVHKVSLRSQAPRTGCEMRLESARRPPVASWRRGAWCPRSYSAGRFPWTRRPAPARLLGRGGVGAGFWLEARQFLSWVLLGRPLSEFTLSRSESVRGCGHGGILAAPKAGGSSVAPACSLRVQGFDRVVPPFEALLKFHGASKKSCLFPKRIGTLHV